MLDAIPRQTASAECEQNAEDKEGDGNVGNVLLRAQCRNGWSDNQETHEGRPQAKSDNQKVFWFHDG